MLALAPIFSFDPISTIPIPLPRRRKIRRLSDIGPLSASAVSAVALELFEIDPPIGRDAIQVNEVGGRHDDARFGDKRRNRCHRIRRQPLRCRRQGRPIVALAEFLPAAAREIDATGRLVMPGGIDSHVHLAQPSGPVS